MSNESENMFSSEYMNNPSETSSEPVKNMATKSNSSKNIAPAISIDQRYGIDKPKRIKIRGKIINDTSEE